MNKILIILSFVVLTSCAPNEVPSKDLIERQGLTYEVNSQTPFSGISVEYYFDTIIKNEFEDRVLLQRTTFTKGIKNGLYESFHPNGAWHEKNVNYKDGKLDGLVEVYYDNGQLEQKGNFKDGEQHGLVEIYHENGQLKEEKNYIYF
jgi:antitoxin component YwqK of YwqJK toxin-antitoxin module